MGPIKWRTGGFEDVGIVVRSFILFGSVKSMYLKDLGFFLSCRNKLGPWGNEYMVTFADFEHRPLFPQA